MSIGTLINSLRKTALKQPEDAGLLNAIVDLIKRHESGLLNRGWIPTPPRSAGKYEIICDENGYEPEEVEVINDQGVLVVDCPHTDVNTLETYHNNLIDLHWRKR